MKNGLVYTVNNNEKYVNMMVNSANSFFHFNEGLIENTTLYILTDADELDLSGLNQRIDVKYVKVDPAKYDNYNTTRKRIHCYTWFKLEVFGNPELRDLDNLLYADCDTVFGDSVEELFVEYLNPTIYVVPECCNNMRNKKKEWKYGSLKCDIYFNAGFIFLTPNLIGEKTLEAIYNESIRLADTYVFKCDDQDCLNGVLNEDNFNYLLSTLPKPYNFALWTSPRSSREEFDAAVEYKMKHFGGHVDYELKFI